ncbi:MAG: flavin-containing monooxygenase, partial [Acidimicrobiales bacterium]
MSGSGDERATDVVVVGAGFAGLYMLHRLRKLGLSVEVIEAGGGVGGTWYWNRYPGARCDVQSMEYSYSFDDDLQIEWEWSERYAPQPEILGYLDHVADRFDLRRDIRFDTRVVAAVFDEERSDWLVTTDAGGRVRARFVVMATGCLSSANLPDIDGRDSFVGASYHTGQWPHDGVDFTDQRVGVIGTGSSAVQSIPIIAEQADHLTVFQRTPTYSVPAYNGPLDPDQVAQIKADYPSLRDRNRMQVAGFGAQVPPPEGAAMDFTPEERQRTFEERWKIGGLSFLSAFVDLIINPDANEAAAEFVRGKIRQIVNDPKVAARLSPTQKIGCKRLCVDTGYYETYNRPNVTLVDLQETPIEVITPDGIQTSAGKVDLDAIVFATGFDAMTGSLLKVDIRGRGDLPLAKAWEAGPVTYLGLGVPGFPNLFMITGPGSPSVLTNMVVSIEQHVDWIAGCIADLDAAGHATIEATPEATDQWVGYVNAVAGLTLFPSCNSWYLGANGLGKPRVFR